MGSSKKEQKKKFHIQLNVGMIVFLVVALYLVGYSASYLAKHKLATYEVSKSDITDVIKESGVIIRDETLVTTPEAGYINYYMQDGMRTKKGGIVYILDKTGKTKSYITKKTDGNDNISEDEKNKIYDKLQEFTSNYTDMDFTSVYETKNDISHMLVSYSDTLLSKYKKKLIKKYGKDSYIEMKSDASGIICFSSDGYEELKVLEVNRAFFNQTVKMQELRTNDKVEAGSPVYRIINSQRWRLVVPITEDEYNRLERLSEKGEEYIEVNVSKDNFETTAKFKTKVRDDGYYVVLIFDNYVQRYMNQRFLTVEMILSDTDGLMVPSTSLTTKQVYKIPKSLVTSGGNSSTANQVSVVTTDKKGQKILNQKTVTVYNSDDDNAWVYSKELKKGDVLSDPGQTQTFTLDETVDLQGVFLVNRGFAEFKSVEIVERTTDYCIISADGSDVELYDRIILNSDTIKENQVIY